MTRFAPFAAVLALAASTQAAALDDCPQPRFTGRAPPEYYDGASPVAAGADLSEARRIYIGDRRGVSCATCHGERGDGHGEMASQFDPPPRNFRCASTVNGIPDGQLFWIIRFGSPGTSMPPHPGLSDDQVWKIVAWLRQIAK